MANQTIGIGATALAPAYVIALAANLPMPVASVLATAGLISAAALKWRRATKSVFRQRLNTAVLATALGLGALLAGVAGASVLAG